MAKVREIGGWGKGYGYQYRSPGEGVGKGLDQVDVERDNAWGSDYQGEYDFCNEDYNNWQEGNHNGGLGYMALILEKGEKTENNADLQNRLVQTTTACEFDGLRRTRRATPITIQNRFDALLLLLCGAVPVCCKQCLRVRAEWP